MTRNYILIKKLPKAIKYKGEWYYFNWYFLGRHSFCAQFTKKEDISEILAMGCGNTRKEARQNIVDNLKDLKLEGYQFRYKWI